MYHILYFYLLPKQKWIFELMRLPSNVWHWKLVTNMASKMIYKDQMILLKIFGVPTFCSKWTVPYSPVDCMVCTVWIVHRACCSSTYLEYCCSELGWFRNLEIRCMIKSQLILEMWFLDYRAPTINPRFEKSLFRSDASRSVLCCTQYESYCMIKFLTDTDSDMSFDVKLGQSR